MPSSTDLAQALVVQLRERLQQLRAHTLAPHAFSDWARAQQALLDALPPKFDVVLQDLLNRLEAGALFSEESCSFSQDDLYDSLQLWLDKAAQNLNNAAERQPS